MTNSINGVFVKNKQDTIQIVAEPYYGAFLKVDIFNQDTNLYISKDNIMTELIEPITDYSSTIQGNFVIGNTEILLSDVSGFSISDRVKLGNYIYRIKNILGNYIHIDRGLFENISTSPAVKKGNLGIYKIDLLFTESGLYTLIAKDNIFGLKTTRMVKVQDKSIEDMSIECLENSNINTKKLSNLLYAILGN